MIDVVGTVFYPTLVSRQVSIFHLPRQSLTDNVTDGAQGEAGEA